VGRLHERGLVDPEPLDEAADVRQRRLADADDADVLAFDQLDLDQAAEQLLQRRGAHPPGGAAAEDDHADGFGCGFSHHAVRSEATAIPIPSSLRGAERRSNPWRSCMAPWIGWRCAPCFANRYACNDEFVDVVKACGSPSARKAKAGAGKPAPAEAIHPTPDGWISLPSPRAPCPWSRQ
jgi:hypothetical protein